MEDENSETINPKELQEIEGEKEAASLVEALTLISSLYIEETLDSKFSRKVLEKYADMVDEDEEFLEEASGGQIFEGELDEESIELIKDVLGIDITAEKQFELQNMYHDGESYQGWISPKTGENEICVLRRDDEEGQTTLIAFPRELIEVLYQQEISVESEESETSEE